MKIRKLITATLLGLLSGLAAASEFDGLNVQLGLGGSSASTNVTGFTGMNSNANYDDKSTQSSLNGTLSLGYSKELPSAYGLNLAANVFYVLGNQNAGNGGKATAWTEGSTQKLESSTSKRKLQNTFGISIEPGLNFNQKTLGFLKLAWVNSQQNMVNTYKLTDPAVGISGMVTEFNQTRTVNGFGYGLGLKKMVMPNVFLAIDAMSISYNTASFGGDGSIKSRPTQVFGFASVGYKF